MIFRHVDRHDVFLRHIQCNTLFGIQQRLFQHLGAHQRGSDGKGAVGLLETFFHMDADFPVFPNDIKELLHQLIALVLQELVTARCGFQAVL